MGNPKMARDQRERERESLFSLDEAERLRWKDIVSMYSFGDEDRAFLSQLFHDGGVTIDTSECAESFVDFLTGIAMH